MSTTADELREEVRRRYAESARAVTEGTSSASCGGGSCCADADADSAKFGEALYDADQRGDLPETATLGAFLMIRRERCISRLVFRFENQSKARMR